MVKPDEIEFIKRVRATERIPSSEWDSLTKKQYYWLDKWTDKGFWEYGVSLRSGWLTAEGKNEFSKY